MFPHRSLFLAILRVAIFSIEVPEAKSITCLRRQPRARNALSFGTEVLKMAPEELPELTTGGGFNFTFFIYWTGLLFHLIMETFFSFFPCTWQPCFLLFSSDFWNAYVNHVCIPKVFGMCTWITNECIFYFFDSFVLFFGIRLNHERIWILVWFL